jgi:hypothetical protein
MPANDEQQKLYCDAGNDEKMTYYVGNSICTKISEMTKIVYYSAGNDNDV